MPNGVTFPHCGDAAAEKLGGVGCQTPGPDPGVYGTCAVEPSVLRQARICWATACPTAVPSIARPGGIPARSAASVASYVAWCAGNSATIVSCAAWAAAAWSEAPRGALTSAKNGVYDRS